MKLIIIISIVFGVLQLILFFKIWQMTDDVRAIRIKLAPENDTPQLVAPTATPEDGARVFVKSFKKAGILLRMCDGQAYVELEDGSHVYTAPYDIQLIEEAEGKD